jgi:hypothetical protein
MGTAAGTKVFVEHGWRATALLSLAWMGLQLGVLFLRGPHAPRKTWIGWQGGWNLRRQPEEGEEEEQKGTEIPDEKKGVRDMAEPDKEKGI